MWVLIIGDNIVRKITGVIGYNVTSFARDLRQNSTGKAITDTPHLLTYLVSGRLNLPTQNGKFYKSALYRPCFSSHQPINRIHIWLVATSTPPCAIGCKGLFAANQRWTPQIGWWELNQWWTFQFFVAIRSTFVNSGIWNGRVEVQAVIARHCWTPETGMWALLSTPRLTTHWFHGLVVGTKSGR